MAWNTSREERELDERERKREGEKSTKVCQTISHGAAKVAVDVHKDEQQRLRERERKRGKKPPSFLGRLEERSNRDYGTQSSIPMLSGFKPTFGTKSNQRGVSKNSFVPRYGDLPYS